MKKIVLHQIITLCFAKGIAKKNERTNNSLGEDLFKSHLYQMTYIQNIYNSLQVKQQANRIKSEQEI